MISPIGLYLTEISPEGSRPDVPFRCFAEGGSLDDLGLPEDTEGAELDKARREGIAEGSAAAESAHAAELAALEVCYAEDLAAERRRWSEAEGEDLASRLEQGLAEIEARLAASVTEILEPFLDRALRAKVTAEFREAIGSLLGNGSESLIQVTGPADLLEPLRIALGEDRRVTLVAADRPDLSLVAGDTAIRSQLEAWTKGLGLDRRGVR